MKVAFYINAEESYKFKGDRRCLNAYQSGLESLGVSVYMGHDLDKVLEADEIFLSNICVPLTPKMALLQLSGRRFNLIPFYSNFIESSPIQLSFIDYVRKWVEAGCSEVELQLLESMPTIFWYNNYHPDSRILESHSIVKAATLCLANTPTEAKWIQRDCPAAHTKHILLSPGLATGHSDPIDDRFCKTSGFSSKSYILQVGRIEPRKNQLATLLSTFELDLPIAFIAADHFASCEEYRNLVFEIAARRKAPTIVFSHEVESKTEGNLQLVRIPKENPFDHQMLLSAFRHCGLYLHPAFDELPGYVYLEAAATGAPIVASSWTTLKDYFPEDPTLNGQIKYCQPYRLKDLKKAVVKQFGITHIIPKHPIFQRSYQDMGRELINLFETIKNSQNSLHV